MHLLLPEVSGLEEVEFKCLGRSWVSTESSIMPGNHANHAEPDMPKSDGDENRVAHFAGLGCEKR